MLWKGLLPFRKQRREVGKQLIHPFSPCVLFEKRRGFFFRYFKVPFVLRHHRHHRSPLAVICTTGFDDLYFSSQTLLFDRTLQLLIKVFASAFFAFASAAYIENTIRGTRKFLQHAPKLRIGQCLLQILHQEIRFSKPKVGFKPKHL